jgi:hypothetical protein
MGCCTSRTVVCSGQMLRCALMVRSSLIYGMWCVEADCDDTPQYSSFDILVPCDSGDMFPGGGPPFPVVL